MELLLNRQGRGAAPPLTRGGSAPSVLPTGSEFRISHGMRLPAPAYDYAPDSPRQTVQKGASGDTGGDTDFFAARKHLMSWCLQTTGEGGIRTLDTLLGYDALAKRCFRPLSHLTKVARKPMPVSHRRKQIERAFKSF